MNYTYPQFVKLYFQITGSWTDASSYAVSTFDGEQTIGKHPLDMLAYAGTLKFELNNYNNTFSPDHDNCLTGFGEGTPAKLTVGYEGVENDIFVGKVGKLTFDNEVGSPLRAYVTLYDWLQDAVTHKIENFGVETNKRGDEIIATVIADMDVQPVDTVLQEGEATAETVFDVSTSETTTYAEMQRATSFELGYCYLQKDGTLVFEAADYRNGLRELSKLPSSYEDLYPLLTDPVSPTQYMLLAENGNPILVDTLVQADFDNTMEKLDLEYGGETVNYLTMWQYPRKVDTSPVTLFTLNEPMLLVNGRDVEIKGFYTDPVGGNSINGQNIITPATGTADFQVFRVENGVTGSSLTGDLQTISSDFGSEGFTHTVRNTSSNPGWLVSYRVRGYGVYTYNPTQRTSRSAQSIEDRGMRTETLHQRYARTGDRAKVWGDAFIDYHKTPRTEIKAAHFTANISPFMMKMFLGLEIGSLIRLRQTQRNVDGLFYIQGIKYSISLGGVIVFKWILRAVYTLLLGLSPIAVEFGGEATTDAINYGYLPQLANIPTRTIFARVYVVPDAAESVSDQVAGLFSDNAAFQLNIGNTTRHVGFIQKYIGNQFQNGGQGVWNTPSGTFATGTWTDIAVVKDLSSDNPPLLYINGVSQIVGVQQAPPVGSIAYPEDGVNFVIGNWKTETQDYNRPFSGRIKDVRVYSRGLTADELLTLHNGGEVTEGLIFRGPNVRTRELSSYINQILNDGLKVIDDIRNAVGTPHGNPIGRNP